VVNRATRFGVATLAGGVMLGLIEILVARHGVASHPVLGYALLLTGVLLGVAPLRIGLPIAIVLGCNQGFILYFIGGSGRYWKEAFVATLVVRALRANRLGQLDIVAGCGVAALGIAYGLRASGGHLDRRIRRSCHCGGWGRPVRTLAADGRRRRPDGSRVSVRSHSSRRERKPPGVCGLYVRRPFRIFARSRRPVLDRTVSWS
jgi:hypothetical protein